MTQLTRPACMGLIGWDRLAGTGVATAQKKAQHRWEEGVKTIKVYFLSLSVTPTDT